MNGRWACGLVAGVMLGAAAIAAAPAASADDACGTKENPCPLQKWMRQNMAPANASGDMAALATDFDKVSKIAPDAKWNGSDPKANWDAIARAGVAAAKASDAAAVKAACKGCHDAFKDKYKAQFRTKAVP
ncbi:MAG: hypothetical protein ACLQVI_13705 [Polyangiaceae bacterium]|jgi:hypothetical protein